MTVHDLKIWPDFFDLHICRQMEFQIRRDDRPFQFGDQLRLREFDPATGKYTGFVAISRVTSVNRRLPGLEPGFVALGAFFEKMERKQEAEHDGDE